MKYKTTDGQDEGTWLFKTFDEMLDVLLYEHEEHMIEHRQVETITIQIIRTK